MTNAELIAKIKAEIERQIDEIDKTINNHTYYYLSKLLAFIDHLPAETSGDLEKAAYKYTNSEASRTVGRAWLQRDVRHAFIAGANWQKEQDEKEQADLFIIVALDAAHRAREQMMKEAVEGLFWNTPFPTICLVDCKNYNFKDNQKVRIIIVKED